MADDGYQYELEEGRLIRMPPSVPRSSIVATNVAIRLGMWVLARRLGKVAGADLGFYVARKPDTVRAADAVFYRAERLPAEGIPSRYWGRRRT